ncbi:MAG: YdeI/OmpD-associated family protein [Bacteroidia bacterium]
MIEKKEFTTILEELDSAVWSYHFVVPQAVAQYFIERNEKRVVCTLNHSQTYQCGLMPKGEGEYFINVNKTIRNKLGITLGDSLQVCLVADESEYGLPMPEELAELFKMDDEGSQSFHALTMGKQRSLLYWVGVPKTTDGRIRRALALVEHLKQSKGKPDFKVLNEKVKVSK